MILFTANYPYGKVEPYLEAELKTLSQHFRHIYIINTGIRVYDEPAYYMPPNATAHQLPQATGIKDKLLSLLGLNFFHLFREIAAFRHYKTPLRFSHIKTLLVAAMRAGVITTKLLEFMAMYTKKPDQVLLYTYWCDDVAYAIARVRKKYPQYVKAITRMHAWDLYFERQPDNFLSYRNILLRDLDLVVTVSEHGRAYLLSKFPFADKSRVVTCRLGVPAMRDVPCDTPIGNTFRVLSLSVVAGIKRIDRIILALAGLERDVRVEWHHVGSGTDLSAMQQMAATCLGEKQHITFHFHGNLDRSELKAFFNNNIFDCLINASQSEGLPVSMMEAFSAGIPVVGPDTGAVAEIIADGKNGFLVRGEDAAAYTDAMQRLVSLEDDAYIAIRRYAYTTWQEKFNDEKNYRKLLSNISALYFE